MIRLPEGYWRELLLFGAIVAAYLGVALLVAGETHPVRFNLYSQGLIVMLVWTGAGAAVLYLLHLVLVRRPPHPLQILRDDLGRRLHLDERLLLGVPVVVMVSVFLGVYSSWKVMLPELVPFSWDPGLARWDRALHGGSDPWRWLHPLLGRPLVTSGINFVYNAWLIVLYTVLFWQVFSLADRRLRRQFLVAFFLCWSLLGSALATAMSSAGPCYFGRVTGLEDPFIPLMEYLHQANDRFPIWSLRVQDLLWADYLASTLSAGRGISAMPSMHVASSLLMALVAWRTDPRLGVLFLVFLTVILLGSVHLGWHYALDGYVAIPLTYLLWRLSGAIAAASCFSSRNRDGP